MEAVNELNFYSQGCRICFRYEVTAGWERDKSCIPVTQVYHVMKCYSQSPVEYHWNLCHIFQALLRKDSPRRLTTPPSRHDRGRDLSRELASWWPQPCCMNACGACPSHGTTNIQHTTWVCKIPTHFKWGQIITYAGNTSHFTLWHLPTVKCVNTMKVKGLTTHSGNDLRSLFHQCIWGIVGKPLMASGVYKYKGIKTARAVIIA